MLAVRRPGACHQSARTDSSRRPATATSTQPKPRRSAAPRRPVCPAGGYRATRDTSRIRHSAVNVGRWKADHPDYCLRAGFERFGFEAQKRGPNGRPVGERYSALTLDELATMLGNADAGT